MVTKKSPDPAAEPSQFRTRLGLALILIVSLALRLTSIDHGMPDNYVPDTHIVRSALGMAKDKDLVPEVGKYSTYPNLLAYALLPVYGAQFTIGRAQGKWGSAEEFGEHALAHPEDVHIVARIFFALLGSLLPLVAYRAAREMKLTVGAWVAAWLAATGMLGLHFAIQERPWEPMVLFMLLSTWPAARYVATESRKALALSCGAAALAFGCHQAGGGALLIPAAAWALVVMRCRTEFRAKAGKLIVDGVLSVAGFAVLSIGLGHPYLLVHGVTQTDQVAMGAELRATSGTFSLGGQGFKPSFRLTSFSHLGPAIFSYDPVLILLGVLGFFVSWRWCRIWPVLVFLVAWGGLFLFTNNDHVRYVMPLSGLACLPAGAFVERMYQRFGAPALLKGVFGALMLFPLVQAMRFDYVMAQPDLRAIAGDQLLTNAEVLPEGARLAIAPFGPILPASLQSLIELAEVRPLYRREEYRLAQLKSWVQEGHDPSDPGLDLPGGEGIDVVYLADFIAFEDRDGVVELRDGVLPGRARDDFDGLLDELGVTHVLLVDKTVGDGQLGLLDGHLNGLRPSWLWLPTSELGQVTRAQLAEGSALADPRAVGCEFETRLPTEMDHALRTIWIVDRPGPALYLFDRMGTR